MEDQLYFLTNGFLNAMIIWVIRVVPSFTHLGAIKLTWKGVVDNKDHEEMTSECVQKQLVPDMT
jgi:hypothetical protein